MLLYRSISTTHSLSLATELPSFAQVGIVDCLGDSKLCHETLGMTRNTKGELRYFRSGHKNCEGGVKYLGEHIVDLSVYVYVCVCMYVCVYIRIYVCVCVCVCRTWEFVTHS